MSSQLDRSARANFQHQQRARTNSPPSPRKRKSKANRQDTSSPEPITENVALISASDDKNPNLHYDQTAKDPSLSYFPGYSKHRRAPSEFSETSSYVTALAEFDGDTSFRAPLGQEDSYSIHSYSKLGLPSKDKRKNRYANLDKLEDNIPEQVHQNKQTVADQIKSSQPQTTASIDKPSTKEIHFPYQNKEAIKEAGSYDTRDQRPNNLLRSYSEKLHTPSYHHLPARAASQRLSQPGTSTEQQKQEYTLDFVHKEPKSDNNQTKQLKLVGDSKSKTSLSRSYSEVSDNSNKYILDVFKKIEPIKEVRPKTATTSDKRQQSTSKASACPPRMATSLEDITSLRLWKGIVAEFVGTLLLTLVGCGSCINLRGKENETSPVVQIALCFGLSVATVVWAICHVSGGHVNPAVTCAMLATRKVSLAKAVFFIIFQLVGAVVGAGILYGLTPHEYRGNMGCTLVSSKITPGQGVGVELFVTFVLVFTVFASCDGKRKDLNGSAPLTIGLSVTMCHLWAIDYTGSSMNTARSFGPALVLGKWDDHWVYWAGPILGGVAAGLLYEHIFAVNATLSKARACLLTSDYDDEKYRAKKLKVRIIEEDQEDLNDPDSHEDNGNYRLTEKDQSAA